MTEILAHAVGPEGHVTAVDIASPDYGSPLTLGRATDILLNSEIGNRIDFHFHFDVLDRGEEFRDLTFDATVMAHSSWYFTNPNQLERTLRKIRHWSRQLYFAEWNLEPKDIAQFPHFLSVLIQGQIESFRETSEANVRSPISREHFLHTLEKSGWTPVEESTIESPTLQDADWEIKHSLETALRTAIDLHLPDKFVALLASQLDLLKGMAKPEGNRPLTCYSVTAC